MYWFWFFPLKWGIDNLQDFKRVLLLYRQPHKIISIRAGISNDFSTFISASVPSREKKIGLGSGVFLRDKTDCTLTHLLRGIARQKRKKRKQCVYTKKESKRKLQGRLDPANFWLLWTQWICLQSLRHFVTLISLDSNKNLEWILTLKINDSAFASTRQDI